MNKIGLFFVFVFCVFLQFSSSGQVKALPAADADMVKKSISDAARSTTSLESGFIQTKELSVIKEQIVSKGTFYLKKTRLLRWEYTDPFAYLIIFNKDRIYVKDEDKENHINIQSNKVFREVNNILIGAIQGTLLQDTRNFQCSIFDQHDQFRALLVPVNQKLRETISEITLYFSKSDYTVEKLVMREASGDYTRIEFVSKKINQLIPDEKFAIP